MVSAALTNRRSRFYDGLWLGFAVVIHALLLAIPMAPEPTAKSGNDSVQVILMARPPAADPLVEIPTRIEPETPLRQSNSEPRTVEQAEVMALLEETREEVPASPHVILSTALLLDSASQFDWPGLQVKNLLQLGVHTSRPMPENWRAGIGIEENLFNGLVVPRKTEIVDRWLAADGSHNVVINTPTGDTLCGRALPWNPMQPLVEHVMQFRLCGGGGKRSFTMPQRVPRTDGIIGVANSTTN